MQITAVRTLTRPPSAPGVSSSVSGSTVTVSATAPTPTGQSVIAGYRFRRATSAGGPYTLVQDSLSTTFNETRAPGTYFYTVEAYDQFVTGAQGSTSCSVQTQSIIYQPNGLGFGLIIGDIGGRQATSTAANADWSTQMNSANNQNSSRIIKHFWVVTNWKLMFPVVQGDWANSQGIGVLRTLFNNVAALSNGPYTISVACNCVGNTFTSVSQSNSEAMCPSWWINNAAYGTVSGDNHGGLYYHAATSLALGALGPNLRIDNANCLNEMTLCMHAIYSALEAEGKHIYIHDPFLELSIGAPGWVNMGVTDASFTNAMAVMAPTMRTAMPTSMNAFRPTFMRGGVANSPALLEAVLPNIGWVCSNYDSTNLVIPADFPSGRARSYDGDKAFCGQATVNGPVTTKNYKALGYDHHCSSSADNLGQGNNTGTVPPALLGNGRIQDLLTNDVYCNSSHHAFWWQGFRGPRCNTAGAYTGQPANYAYPVGGFVTATTNLVTHLAEIGTGSLRLGRPAAW